MPAEWWTLLEDSNSNNTQTKSIPVCRSYRARTVILIKIDSPQSIDFQVKIDVSFPEVHWTGKDRYIGIRCFPIFGIQYGPDGKTLESGEVHNLVLARLMSSTVCFLLLYRN